uniref:Integrase, catalytic region, zinc finger, CCHC-type, peptidase aspartic, catalytic n=1 Tax=Tanacetum cinerariifolium TaxID=118510 RepID=A0A6L2KXZ0_TANCI|nr:integrase, catalytic region, zinc finger, CCHC-type, peptidase aspartic, catalytic [Tanacetum cinerariifolium]
MLDRTDFASWQQRIRHYCRGKDNGVNILKSIDEGPYKLGTFRETLVESTKGTPQFGPERPRVYSDLNSVERDRYNADIRATDILLQGLPKDIYTLINHYTDAKDIWDNVKMLIEGSELTKEDMESQLYDKFEHFRQHKEESINDYYVRFSKLINDMRNIKMTMPKLQLNSKFVNNMLPEWEHVEEEEEDELYRDVNINLVSSQFVTSMLNPTSNVDMESIFATASSSVAPLPSSTPIMTPSTIATITTTSQAPIPPTPVPSKVLQNLPTFSLVFRFDDRLKSLEANFSEYRQTNPFAEAVSAIPGIVHQYMNQQMNEAVKGQVKEQVSKILPRIEQSVNAQLEAEVLIRSSHSSRTSYEVVADLSEMELKKILIEKMEGNKSIQHSDEQRNLYKALFDAYEADKIILDSYGETVILKRRRDDDDDDDKDEGPFAGSDRGSKRWREGKEPESASAPLETTTRSAGRSITGSKFQQASVSESAFAEEPVQTTSQIEEPSHPKPLTPDRDWNITLPGVQGSTQTWISELEKQANTRSYFNELLDTPLDFSNFIMNRLSVDTLTPELLAEPTYELMKGSYLQLGFKSYQKRLNLTKPDTYRSDLKRREAYTAHSKPRRFIYQNKDKKNRLMRIDELHKFNDGTLNDVRTALDDRLKGIRMQYLPQTIWRKGDKDRAAAMIQAIDKMLKTMRIMRSLEKFVGGRLYKGDFQML